MPVLSLWIFFFHFMYLCLTTIDLLCLQVVRIALLMITHYTDHKHYCKGLNEFIILVTAFSTQRSVKSCFSVTKQPGICRTFFMVGSWLDHFESAWLQRVFSVLCVRSFCPMKNNTVKSMWFLEIVFKK